ncbi:Pantoate-beta-alanine ligase, partial [Gigaspora rosea]
VKQANKLCKAVAVSIFVNPVQFASNEDLDKYPRSLSNELAKISTINCVDAIFFSKEEDIYSARITLDLEKQFGTFVEVKGKSHQVRY